MDGFSDSVTRNNDMYSLHFNIFIIGIVALNAYGSRRPVHRSSLMQLLSCSNRSHWSWPPTAAGALPTSRSTARTYRSQLQPSQCSSMGISGTVASAAAAAALVSSIAASPPRLRWLRLSSALCSLVGPKRASQRDLRALQALSLARRLSLAFRLFAICNGFATFSLAPSKSSCTRRLSASASPLAHSAMTLAPLVVRALISPHLCFGCQPLFR